VVSWVQGNTFDIGWVLMILVGLTIGDTLFQGFLSGTSYVNVVDNISFMVLPENMASSGSLGHLSKGLSILYKWCSSSSSGSKAVGDFWGCSTFLEIDPASSVGFFFFKNYGGNE